MVWGGPLCAYGSQPATYRSPFSLSTMWGEKQTQVVRLDGNHPYPVSHLSSAACKNFFNKYVNKDRRKGAKHYKVTL